MFLFSFFCKAIIFVWLSLISVYFKSNFIISPCPPIALVAYTAAAATTMHSAVVAFQFWCDGWCGDCNLAARPLVI